MNDSLTRILLERASSEDMPALSNLLELYSYDFSELVGLELGSDGRYGYKHLPLYFNDENRHPFLIRYDGKLAGFVLVGRGSEVSGAPDVWDIAEFFVLRSYRRHKIGTEVAHRVWRTFPGRWEVRVRTNNEVALGFWKRAISSFQQDIFSEEMLINQKVWRVYSFDTRFSCYEEILCDN